MKRRLINFDTFSHMSKESVINSEHELQEAANVISKALDVNYLELHGFTDETVLFETPDHSFIHATYKVNDNAITFDNIEELVINEESEAAHCKELLRNMVDSLIEGEEEKATHIFDEYINERLFKTSISESFRTQEIFKTVGGKKKSSGFRRTKTNDPSKRRSTWHKRQSPSDVHKRVLGRKKAARTESGSSRNKANLARKRVGQGIKTKSFNPRKHMAVEWAQLSENVLHYCDYVEFGPVLRESAVQHDDKGNITAIRVPSSKLRNEGKILKFNWKTLDHEVKVLRERAMSLTEDKNFCSAVLSLKKNTRLSDEDGLTETLEKIVTNFPSLIYLTQTELAKMVGDALEVGGEKSYDDIVCDQMAEGILRMAHNAYGNKVSRLLQLANTKIAEDAEDTYAEFQRVVSDFFPSIDESFKIEMSVFGDLYHALEQVYSEVDKQGDDITKEQTVGYLNELAAILNGEAKVDMDLAEEVAEWLISLVETNLTSSDWNVSNSVHNTINGDHPAMAEKARQSYSPASDLAGDAMSGGPGGAMIGQDSMNYKSGAHKKEAQFRSWGNIGGKDVYPSLDNPNIPKPFGDYTMKGETGVDKDTFGQHHASWQSGDTWPNLQNPYIPNAIGPKGWRMKADNLIIDK